MREIFLLCFFSVLAFAQTRMDQRIRAAIGGFQGDVSLYAKNLDTGVTYGIRENDRSRTASTIKLAIMTTVFDAVAHGRAKWTEKLVLHASDKVGGTSVLHEFSDGVHVPIRDLLLLRIVL